MKEKGTYDSKVAKQRKRNRITKVRDVNLIPMPFKKRSCNCAIVLGLINFVVTCMYVECITVFEVLYC